MSDAQLEQVTRFLGHVSLFENVKPEYLPSIAKRVEERVFARGQIIFNEGEPGDTLYIVKAGSVGVFLVDAKVGLRFELARLRSGQVFGEMAMLTEQPRGATCQAMEPTECILISRPTFMAIVERVPQVALSVAEVLANRVDQLNRERGQTKVELSELRFDPDVYRMIPGRILERHKMIPLSIQNGIMSVACVDATDLTGLDEIRRIVRGVEIRPVTVGEADYLQFLRQHATQLPQDTQRAKVRRSEPIQWVSDDIKETKLESGSDDIKILVDMLVSQGIELEASDIHIEPELEQVNVRYRVSGLLQRRQGQPIPRAYHRALASRIKVLADLDISERRRPQDGRITLKMGQRQYDLRVSTMPTHEGEKIVLRILDTAAAIQPIERLILADKVCRVVKQLVQRPHGVVFVCGPTGSGKTTTLYSAVGLRRREDTNIVTVEDPVEYNLPGITQVSVNPEIGLKFASVLRSFLRQDPNVILVGETRDAETGKIALEAGLTGHLVLTSLHTNDALGSIQRLREMGLEDYAIAASLVGVISQRLVRRLCPMCAKEDQPSPHVLEQLAMIDVLSRDFKGGLKKVVGCETCGGTGYRGRVGVYELLVADDNLRQEIIAGSAQFKLREAALKGAFVPMERYSHYLLTQGLTTPEELLAIHAGKS
ncbi:MAG: Flp pilus assembly complex ATPase component TadA [Myxococcales bacterium]|nr:Flp pilus assembly complex ATPase component TadA [Myxococcales bacterium]